MCQTTMSDIDEANEISSSTSNKKTGILMEPRKIRKPLMEKKRRARINQSLDELKRIVVDAQKIAGQDLSRINKLEKADILEMTVKYLKRKATPPANVYKAGYRQCIEHVQELLAEQWTDERRQQSGRHMVKHLETCVQRLNVPPQENRLSLLESSHFSNKPNINNDLVVRNNSSSSSMFSSDEDSVEELELLTVAPNTTTAANNHKTNFQNTPPLKPTWRPW